ncbi:SAF domain-containing protein [Demequina activiva]|uniref:Flagellar protein FlgA n=1 Tax=Demequina activiva TaxID=1582364 RepID=A0A919Q405_9MICO|nr:SAF domain-containing protein [Demequina activiva]GIG55411.1 flagellar protein FlgA [Demequina activiva]
MADDGSVAGRLRRPTWRDPRLLVGILLMTVAVVGVAAAVRAADQTEPHYVAARTLVPGTVIDREDLDVVRVRIEDGAYLPVDTAQPWGDVVTRTVAAGELVPQSSVEPEGAYDGRVIGVVAHAPLAPDLVAGATVDLWIAPPASDALPTASLVAENVVVADVDRDSGGFAVSGGQTVYLAVPQDQVQAVLDALSAGGDVTIVGRGGS